jgi:replication-associated recombination protein RarA
MQPIWHTIRLRSLCCKGQITSRADTSSQCAHSKLMKDIGYGDAYRYAHDCPEAYAAGENYFPENMPEVSFYHPTAYGLEQKIQEKLAYLRNLDKQAKA